MAVAKPSRRTRSSSRASAARSVIVSGVQPAPAARRAARRRRRRGRPCRWRCSGSRRGARPSWPAPRKWRAVDLGEVVDAVGRGHGEVDRLAARLARAPRARAGRARRRCALDDAAMGEAQDRRAGLELAALRRPAARARGARARSRSREAVLLGRSAASASSPRLSGSSLSSRRGEQLRGAVDRLGTLGGARLMWNSCSTVAGTACSMLCSMPRAGSPSSRSEEKPMFVNTLPRYEILSEDAMADARPRLAADRDRDRDRVPARRGGRGVPRRRPEGRGRQASMLDPEFVLEQVAKAPREFDVQARNPRATIHIGGAAHGVRLGLRAARSCARATCAATRRWTTSGTSCSCRRRSRSSTRRAARSASPTTRRSTRATSTWSTRCRRCRTSPTWAR